MFQVIEKKRKCRLGKLSTKHGDIFTPSFGPDATKGVIKNLAPHEIKNLGGKVVQDNNFYLDNKMRRLEDEIQFILTNTYHMRMYPGDEFIKKTGGVHNFMQWDLPILTDSGGFQVFSLIHGARNLKGKVTDDGAFFCNPYSGEKLELTPENAIDIQVNLGSDIMVVLDDCRHYKDDKELKTSVFRTIDWASRCKEHFKKYYDFEINDRPLLFAVVQGGIDYDLRKFCAEELIKIGFDGYGFGGWAINEKIYFPYELLECVSNILPEDKPRYAMGVGTPDNMLKCIEYGYDLFDCVIPSRNGRHGLCYTSEGEVRISNTKYKDDISLLDKEVASIASKYPKYFLHHLFKIKDITGGELLSIHNLKYFNKVMREKFE